MPCPLVIGVDGPPPSGRVVQAVRTLASRRVAWVGPPDTPRPIDWHTLTVNVGTIQDTPPDGHDHDDAGAKAPCLGRGLRRGRTRAQLALATPGHEPVVAAQSQAAARVVEAHNPVAKHAGVRTLAVVVEVSPRAPPSFSCVRKFEAGRYNFCPARSHPTQAPSGCGGRKAHTHHPPLAVDTTHAMPQSTKPSRHPHRRLHQQ